MLVDEIARVAHEANRALQLLQGTPGIPVAPPWDDLDPDTQAGVVAGVESGIAGSTPRQSHAAWCDFKIANGWVWGPVKDEVQKTHPNLVDYDELPDDQKRKDRMFLAIVEALAPVLPRANAGGHRVLVHGAWTDDDPREVLIDGEPLRHVTAVEVREDPGERPFQLVYVTLRTDQATVLPPGVPA